MQLVRQTAEETKRRSSLCQHKAQEYNCDTKETNTHLRHFQVGFEPRLSGVANDSGRNLARLLINRICERKKSVGSLLRLVVPRPRDKRTLRSNDSIGNVLLVASCANTNDLLGEGIN